MSMTQSIVWALYGILSPLRAALQDRRAMAHLLDEMGWSVEIPEEDLPVLQQILSVTGLIEQLADLMPTLNDMEAGEIVAQVIPIAQEVFDAIDALTNANAGQFASLDAPLNTTEFWGELALDLPEFLLLRWLHRQQHPVLFRLLEFCGIVVETGRSIQYDTPIYELHWDALSQLFVDPINLLSTTYDWGGEFRHQDFLQRLAQLTFALGFSGHLQLPNRTLVDRFYAPDNDPDTYQLEWLAHDDWLAETSVWLKAGLLLLPIPSPSDFETLNALYLGNILEGKTEVDTPLNGGELQLHITSEAEGAGAVGIIFAPDADPEVQTYLPSVNFEISLQYTPTSSTQTDNSSSLSLRGVEGALSISGTPADPEITIRIGTVEDGLVLAVQPGEGDSFVSDFLGETALTCAADVGFVWSNKSGLSLFTDGGLDLLIPLNLHLFGVLTIISLHLELTLEDGLVTGTAAISASGELGPFTLTVADIGVKAQFEPIDEHTTYLARLGSLGVNLGFKPPSGVGADLDFLGIVSGGGYIEMFPETGEYNGIITMQFASIGITAIALIATKLPDNPGMWSMFVSINVNLGGVPLGFGFTLEKIGGLIGVHRAIDTDVFLDGVRTGLLDSILFPEDVIANAPRILSDMNNAFPPAPGSFVVGAMLQIGWGAPTLITVDAGFIIQVPDIILMLIGQSDVVLPDEEAPLVEIHFDVVAVIDLTRGTLAIDAGLRDSEIVGFTLTGQMALRASFLGQPSFLLAMGGFHPAFTPPDSFPRLARLGFGLSVGDWLSISLESYLAVSSNTVQFGAGLYLTAQLVGFRIEGGFDFNTLIYFSPLSFSADMSFYITVSAGSQELMGVLLTGSLSGPNPYFVRGQAQFKFLGLHKEVNIEESIGRKTTLDDPDTIPVRSNVVEAFGEPENWRAVDDGARIGAVLLADASDPDAEPAIHPGGSVEAIQRYAPLDVQLEHYGNTEIAGVSNLEIKDVESGGNGVVWEFVEDWFAPAQYLDMGKDDKLESPSFEMMKTGLRFGDDDAEGGAFAATVYDYEDILHDPEFEVQLWTRTKAHIPDQATLASFNQQKKLTKTANPLISRSAEQSIALNPVRYAIVNAATLVASITRDSSLMTHAEANQKTSKRGRLQIVVTEAERSTL